MNKVRKVTDEDGDTIGVAHSGGQVYLSIGNRVVRLDAARQEEFGQLYVAACHEADAERQAEAAEVTD